MNVYQHRVTLRRIVGLRENQPALYIASAALPLDAFRVSPLALPRVVRMRDLLPLASCAGPNFRRLAPGIANHRAGGGIARKQRGLGAFPQSFRVPVARSSVEIADMASYILAHQNLLR